jgi:DNA primase
VGIVDEDIARVRSSTDFVAVASEHMGLRRVGSRWVGLCPFHNEKTPSFSVNAELGFYYCFGCGAKGDVITFVRELEHLDFVEAVEKLAARAGVALRYDDQTAGRDHQRRARLHETLERAIDWYHERLLAAPDGAAARGYLRRQRGYDGDVVRRYRLGWAPEGRDELVRSLGVPASALVDAGLAAVDESGRYTDFFRGRLLFPIFEAGGRPVGAGGRLLPGGRGPKYKNTPSTAVYDKSRVLYGLNWAKKTVVAAARVVVCEGYTDVIGLQRAGIGEAVATCGTALAEGHIRLLKNFATQIVLAYDADAAGQAAAERLYEWERRFDVDIRIAVLPAGADPADLAQQDPDALTTAVAQAQPYLGFQLDRLFGRADLRSPEGRARAATDAVALVIEHPNALIRDQYLMLVADRCRLDPDRLRQMALAAVPPSAGGLSRSRSPAMRPGSGPESAAPAQAGGAGPPEEPAPPTVSGPELEALRLAVHHPELVADRLEMVLFAHTLARACFDVLSMATTLHEAIAAADPQAADLLQRLAVEDTDAEVDDVMARLVQRAGQRAVRQLEAEMRQAEPEQQAAFVPTVTWLKLTLEALHAEDRSSRPAAWEAERQLVPWLMARDDAEHTEAMR